ncbi:XRE family transcriptional regulator [Streptomyces sp. H27-D2]|uniref:XRE family transcriptional regulator n=1 Tax=Streptomyces sp. H27-D2 TaxID=3046304 RepID=UPI002DBB8925|nr:XRE family transcriptional regulator [Streptomyces sp. H27-D2]MEC4015074.1 XRE family transcriptional regulator [Streptomyces sp. H27-D2]
MRNISLEQAMAERRLTQPELAELVNAEIRNLTGADGRVCDRVVRQWLAGKVNWPQERQRRALEAVFERSAVHLGFTPRSSSARQLEEAPVRRRAFLTSAAAATAAITTPAAANSTSRGRIGGSDIGRLNEKFAAIIAADHLHGGRLATETRALALADEALRLQEQGFTSQRIRNDLYGCAAAFTSSAMWAAIDGRRFEAAQVHLDRASSLATMSGDHAIHFRIWSHAGSLYRHLRRPSDALAANDVARRTVITRRDPLFASLGHARHAAILGLTGDKSAVQRSLERARHAFESAAPDPTRPVWLTAFYDRAELESLSVAAHLALGDYAQAEAHAHRSLGLLMPELHRTRAITHARLALAQLGQGDLEPAISTAMAIPADTATRHVRVAGMLHDLGRRLHTVAPGSNPTHTWDAYVHDTLRTGT